MSRHGGSLLIKIFFIYLFTAVTISLVLFLGFRLMQSERSMPKIIEKNAIQYLLSIEQKIGEKPALEDLKKLYQDLFIKLRRADLSEILDSSPEFKDLPSLEVVDMDRGHELSDKIKFGRIANYFYAEIKNHQPRTVWFVSTQNFPKAFIFPIAWVLGFILLILLMSFVSIQFIMRPVGLLLTGANELATGNLKFRMPSFRSRDFNHIAGIFNQIAEKLEKLVTNKDLLLRDVSHELRSPLTRISVAAEMIQDESLKISIKEDVRKIDHLIGQVLENYKIRSGTIELKRVHMDLNEFLNGIIKGYQNVEPRIIYEGQESVVCDFDPMMIERVISNIIENAIKYSNENSKPIIINLSKTDKVAEVKIQDFGKGIPEKDLGKIFDPFYRGDKARTSDNTSGFGLGLAISKSILDQHGYNIKVSSQINQGTLVNIQMALAK